MTSVTQPSVVLITPARNEGGYIERTILSVLSQAVLPVKWIIVSDGSTDSTEDIVRKYSARHAFIELMRNDSHDARNFGAKVRAFQVGVKRVHEMHFDFIGNLDADVTFGPDYLERILEKFGSNDRLGIAGGDILEMHGDRFQRRINAEHAVAGAVQLFRRRCFEDVGGLNPYKLGGEEWVAQVIARHQGWEVQTFKELEIYHHRRVGLHKGSALRGRFLSGVKESIMGTAPLFLLAKCFRRIQEKPVLFGAIAILSGYLLSKIKRDRAVVDSDFIRMLRQEQGRILSEALRSFTRREEAQK
ncbi:MAG TPA: glycosyltransferase [Candidatus Deferrimicrobiaceae bacterium]|jgi:hypothetical protein